MKSNKRMLVLIGFILAIFLVACGSNNDGETNGNKGEKAKELVWAGWSGEEEASKDVIKSMIDDWNEEQPNSTFKWLGWPWDNTLEQLIIRSQGGEALDVAQVDIVWLKALVNAGVLEDVGELIGQDWLEENIEEAVLKTGEVDGVQYGIPWTTASIGMINNPSLLEAAGIDSVPESIEEFEEALAKVKESNPDVIPYALTTKGGGTAKDFMQWLWTFDGDIFNENDEVVINNENGIEALTWLKENHDKGYIAMDMDRFTARQMYATDQVAFYDDAILARGILESNGVDASELDDKIQPMLRPVQSNGDTPQSVMWGHVLVVFKDSSDSDQAAEFIKHLISEEQSLKYFDEEGLPPVIESAISSEQVQSSDWTSEWLNITATGKNAETINYENSSELDGILSDEIQAALIGDKTPEEALNNAATRIEKALE